jgi:hypothetical protein
MEGSMWNFAKEEEVGGIQEVRKSFPKTGVRAQRILKQKVVATALAAA